MKNKSTNNTRNIVNYTRTKDAYDGNMELTNLKSTKPTDSTIALSTDSRKTKETELGT